MNARSFSIGVVLVLSAAVLAEDVTLRVTVTAVSGRSLFIDRGRIDGVESGLTAVFFTPDAAQVEGTVREVATDSARVELPPGVSIPPVGTQGEIEVKAPEAAPGEKPPEAATTPSHEPWTRPPEVRTPDMPLLAPVYRQRAEDRPPTFRGRVLTQYDHTWDSGGDRDSEYYFGRLGISGKATNLFHSGDVLQFSAQTTLRGYNQETPEGVERDSDNLSRIDRLSFSMGGYEYSPYRLDVGRFYSVFTPELGLLDGVEAAVMYRSGLRLGGGVGFLPLPSPLRKTGDDFGAHIFAAYQSREEHALSGVLTYQHTWHHGDSDRDLIVGRLNVKPTPKTWLLASFKADVYTSSDTIEGSGIELTQAMIQGRYTPTEKYGFGLSLSHFGWAEMLREEYGEPLPELIKDGRVDRTELSSWYKFTPHLRLTGRVNYWSDQYNDGTGGQLGVDWTDIGGTGLSLLSSVRYTDSANNEGVGFRCEARKSFGEFYTYVAYDMYRYTTTGLEGAENDYTRQTVRGGLDWNHGNWYLSLSAHYDFGDNQDAVGLGLYTEYRF